MTEVTLRELLRIPAWDWPEESTGILHHILVDRHAPENDRGTAAILAGELIVINDQLAADLLAIAGESGEPDKLRAAAAVGLGPVLDQCNVKGFEDPDEDPISEETFERIKRALHRLYSDTGVPKLVRRKVLEAAASATGPWLEEAVRAAYATGDRDWKLTSVVAMQSVPGFEREILESLNSADIEIQCEAVTAAGNKELGPAWPHVSGLLTSEKTPKDLLLAAIDAAGQIRPEEALDTLVKLAGSKDPDIAYAAGEALFSAEDE